MEGDDGGDTDKDQGGDGVAKDLPIIVVAFGNDPGAQRSHWV